MAKNASNLLTIEAFPHLVTAVSGPLHYLGEQFLKKRLEIEAWFRLQWQQTRPNMTCSVDLRNAGFKLAPVDVNLFPAGFNNLNEELMPLCIQVAQVVVGEALPKCRKILLLPETQSRNPYYWESLAVLEDILLKAGFDVQVGFLDESLKQAKEIVLPSKRKIMLKPVSRQGNRIVVDGFDPCLVLLNNDLSTGIPDILKNLDQPICPSIDLGWSVRLKSKHFEYYQKVCDEFAELIDIDPWLIAPLFSRCGEVDFVTREGEDCIVDHAEKLLAQIQNKYQQYNVDQKPFVVVKADSGTYGMGVIVVDDAEEIRQLSRRQRKQMAMLKGRQKLNKVIIQEGVYTFENWHEAVAEPVVYLMGQYVIGGFYRVHTGLGRKDNLNAPGMHFQPLAFSQACNNPDKTLMPEQSPNHFYSYGVVARLSALAAARERINLESK